MSWLSSLFKSPKDKTAKLAASSEAKRKKQVDTGLSQINAVYDGGTVDLYRAPNDASGALYSGPSKGLVKTPQTFTGFTPEFHKQYGDAFVQSQLPQLTTQFNEQNQNGIYGFSNRGLSNSSIYDKYKLDLNNQLNTQKRNIVDQGLERENESRRYVIDSKQAAIDKLYQTANPSYAVQSAITTAGQIPKQSVITPTINYFGDLANQYYINELLKTYRQGGAGAANSGSDKLYFAPTK